MSASLVGSEMCIRDSVTDAQCLTEMRGSHGQTEAHAVPRREYDRCEAVSYTHLTLPTICSV
eukprot:2244899-Alexandrium_andersonii.AAC.1